MKNIEEFWNELKIFIFINSEDILEQIGVILYLLKMNKIDEEMDYYEVSKIFNLEIEKLNYNLIGRNRLRIHYKVPTPNTLKTILLFIKSKLSYSNAEEIFNQLLKNYLREKEKIEWNKTYYNYLMKEGRILDCFSKIGERLFNKKYYFNKNYKIDALVSNSFEENIHILRCLLENKHIKIYNEINIKKMWTEYDLIIINGDFFENEFKAYFTNLLLYNNLSLNGKIVIALNSVDIEKIFENKFALDNIEKIVYNSDEKLVFIELNKKNNWKIRYIKKINKKNLIRNDLQIDKIMEDIQIGDERLDYLKESYREILFSIRKLTRLEQEEFIRNKKELIELKEEIFLELKNSLYY